MEGKIKREISVVRVISAAEHQQQQIKDEQQRRHRGCTPGNFSQLNPASPKAARKMAQLQESARQLSPPVPESGSEEDDEGDEGDESEELPLRNWGAIDDDETEDPLTPVPRVLPTPVHTPSASPTPPRPPQPPFRRLSPALLESYKQQEEDDGCEDPPAEGSDTEPSSPESPQAPGSPRASPSFDPRRVSASLRRYFCGRCGKLLEQCDTRTHGGGVCTPERSALLMVLATVAGDEVEGRGHTRAMSF